jgi:hypothetical protein
LLSTITRDKIIVDRHPRKKARARCLSEETLYEFLTERRYKRIEKKVTDDAVKFEIHYDNPDKSIKRDVIIIILVKNIPEKIIKVVTVIIE